MFLVGGPAFSGTTLLALVLNQDSLLCLDEPDFHDPEQHHRGVPFLQELFPAAQLPAAPEQRLTYEEATDLIERCEQAIRPFELGIKTCDSYFLGYADAYQRRGYPVVCIVRDIRDALARPLPPWLNEAQLNEHYRLIWERSKTLDLCVRYEDLVTDPDAVVAGIAAVLGKPLRPVRDWSLDQVHAHMLKLDRHELLKLGRISDSRIGVWRNSGNDFDRQSHETAHLMGY